jgi:EmrB/QacA subfamily drug resistance transporter
VTGRAELGWPVWRLSWIIVFGAFASGLDASLTNIGLDTISADLHSGLGLAQWVASGYLLALAVSLPVAGWLGRRCGVGRLWLAALAGFTVASGLCTVAPTIEVLIGLRVAQGLAGGLLIPAGQTVIGQAVGSERLGRVVATLGIAVTVAPALGPLVGGLILHGLSWRWLFAINLPIGAAGMVLGARYVPRGTAGQARPLDWLGMLYITTGLPALVYAFTEIGLGGAVARASVIAPMVGGTVVLAAFTVRTTRRPDPLIDLGLYRDRRYTAASVAAGFTGMILFGAGLVFPLYFLIGHHDSVVVTGLRLLGFGGATALVQPYTGRLTDHHGGGSVSAVGCALVVAASLPFAVMPLDAAPALIQFLLAVLGGSIALAAVPPGIVAYKTVRPDQLSDATTQVNIIQRVGGALGGALFSVLIARGLPDDPEAAFHHAFWAIVIAGLLGLLSTVRLRHVLRSQPDAAPRSLTHHQGAGGWRLVGPQPRLWRLGRAATPRPWTLPLVTRRRRSKSSDTGSWPTRPEPARPPVVGVT